MFSLDYQSDLQTLQDDFKQQLNKWSTLSLDSQLSLKENILLKFYQPSIPLKFMVGAVAYAISDQLYNKFKDYQFDVAVSLAAGGLGLYGTNIIKYFFGSDYYVTVMEETLWAAFLGYVAVEVISRENLADGLSDEERKYITAFNIYVAVIHGLPLLLRAIYSRQFDAFHRG